MEATDPAGGAAGRIGGQGRSELGSQSNNDAARTTIEPERNSADDAGDLAWLFVGNEPGETYAEPDLPARCFDELVEAAWGQGFRVEETDRGWYFYAPGDERPCCGLARAQDQNRRVLRGLVAALRKAGLIVRVPSDVPPTPTGTPLV